MEYKIVYGETIDALEKAVYEYLKVGWRPQGGITIEMCVMYQVVVKDNQ